MNRVLPCLVVLLSSLVACEGGDKSSASAASSSAAATSAAAKPPPPPAKEEADLKLTEPGAEPRVALRYEPKSGSKQTVMLTQRITQAAVGAKARSAPSSRITLDVTFKEKTPKGELQYDVAVSDALVEPEAGAAPAMVNALQQAVENIKGLKANLVVSDHGRVRDVKLTVPGTMAAQYRPLADQLGETWRQLPLVLPNAPVGKGAKWEHKVKAKTSGAEVEQISRYELLSIEGKVSKLKIDVDQQAPSQTIEPAPGIQMTLENYKVAGTAMATLDLSNLMPTDSKTELEGIMTMKAPNRPKKDLSLKMTISVQGK